jgi:putative modified peptide
MTQRDVERTLGRLLTDADFRRDFFRNPARACLEVGVQLAAHEVDALLRVPTRPLASLARQLDDRICRLQIAPDGDKGYNAPLDDQS